MATLASRWSTFLSVNQNTIKIQFCSQYIQSTVWIKDCLSSIKITEVCELLIEDTEPGPAAHVKAVEEVSDPLDASGNELNVFPVHPVSLENVVFKQFQRNWRSQKDIKEILHSTHSNPGIGLFSFLTWVWRCRLSLCAWVVARDIFWRVCSLISLWLTVLSRFCCQSSSAVLITDQALECRVSL